MGWSSSIRAALGGGSRADPSPSDDVAPPPITMSPAESSMTPPSAKTPPRFETFDATALERGVAAIRELNESPHAAKALDLTRAQETTKQLEMQAYIEEKRAANNQFAKNAQMEMEEMRKANEAERLNQERQAALYKAKVQSKLEQQQMQERKQYDEEALRQKHEAFLMQEKIRKENDAAMEANRRKSMEVQARFDQETARVKEATAAEGRIKQERANEDVMLRRQAAELAASHADRISAIESHYSNIKSIGASVQEAVNDPIQMGKIVTLVAGLSLGVYGARSGTAVIGKYISARLGRPKLVRETSRLNWLSPRSFISEMRSWATPKHAASNVQKDVILHPHLRTRLQWIADSAIVTATHKSPHRHLLLHGPPGTGKTLFARSLALDSGMDYAVVSGGDFSQMGDAAVTELHQLFDWAEQSSRGAVIFFDEADSFLRSGRDSQNMSEQARHVLSAFLQRTGSDSKKIMLVLASNMPLESFDNAVRDRIDEFVEFALPGRDERRQMIELFFEKYLKEKPTGWFQRWTFSPEKSSYMHEFDADQIAELSELMHGFSGRQIAKFVISMRSAVYGNLAPKVNLDIAKQLLQWRQWDSQTPPMMRKDVDQSKPVDTRVFVEPVNVNATAAEDRL